jgi:hypothetical protein
VPFVPKDWKDFPDTTTPITAAALEDLETRVTNYSTRVVDEKLNVEDFGAHPSESATNNRTYIQNAIDTATAAPGGTRKIFFPRLYQIDSTGLLINEHGLNFEGTGSMNGNASLGAGVYSQTGDVFKIGTTTGSVWSLWFRDMCVGSLSGGGHLFVPQSTTVDQGINQGGMERCLFWQDNPTKSIWRQTAGILLDWKVSDCTHNHVQSATVHAWHLESSSGQLNEVRFVGGRVNNSGTVAAFYLAAIGGGWQDAARWEDINFEVPTGGCIRLLGCWAPVLENLQVWDLGTFGAPNSNNDMFWLGSTGGSDEVRYPSLKNIWRYGTNSLTAGTVDMRFFNVRGGVIENCGGLNNAMTIDLAGAGTAGELIQLTNLSTLHTTLTNAAGKVGVFSPPRAASVATAATIAAPTGVETVNLTGTTNITSITAEPPGRTIELVAGGAMSVVDGSNLNLDSTYAMATGDSLTLRSDGTNWRELSRSVDVRGFKAPVRAAPTVNVNTASPGATHDGVTMAAGDRMLLANQTTASQNGIYQYNGAASALTRTADADTAVKISESLLVDVDEGTANKDSIFKLSTNKPITLGTTALRFTRIHPSYAISSHPSASAFMPTSSKLENMDRTQVQLSNQALLATGTVRVFPMGVVRAGDTLANINFVVGTTASAAVTNSWAGIARLSDRVVLAISATSTATTAANTKKTFAFGSAYTADKDEIVVGFVMYQATVPSLFGINQGNAVIYTEAPVVNGTSNTGATTALSVGATLTAFTSDTEMPYAWCE